MRTTNRSAAHMNRRHQDSLWLQEVQCITDARHIRDGIQRSHFMKMYVAYRTTMCRGFCLCDSVIDPSRLRFHHLRQGKGIDDFRDVSGCCMVMMIVVVMIMVVMMVMMVMMVMIVVVMGVMMVVGVMVMGVMMVVMVMLMGFHGFLLFFSMYCHCHVCTGDSTGYPFLSFHMHTGQSQPIHSIQESLLVFQKIIQRRHQHVASRAHITFDIESLHVIIPP